MSIKVSATPARIALGLLALALLGPFFALNYRGQVRLNELKNFGIATTARITHKQCFNHGQISYAFSVGNRKFRGYGSCPPSCKDAQLGDLVGVTYAPKDPGNSQCISLTEREQIIGSNYYMLLVLAGALAVVIYAVTRVDSLQRPRHGR